MVVASINVLVDRKHGRCYHTSDVSDLTIIGRFINEVHVKIGDMVLCMMFSDIALVEFVLEDRSQESYLIAIHRVSFFALNLHQFATCSFITSKHNIILT